MARGAARRYADGIGAVARRTAAFLDRDGVLCALELRNGRERAAVRLETFRLVDGAREAVQRLSQAGLLAIVVTNQPDVASGELAVDTLTLMNERLQEDAGVDAIYVCPHRDDDRCRCRKPEPGLLLRAAADWNVDLRRSFMIGDTWRDVEAGKRAGCATVLIGQQLPTMRADLRAPDLSTAVTVVLDHMRAFASDEG